MKLVLFADAHLIADTDPSKSAHAMRTCFKTAWPSFVRLLDRINDESPDLVVCLGDLVDWFSPENVSLGLELMSRLRAPWWMTPGNHDLDAAPGTGPAQHAAARAHWAARGCDFRPRRLGDGPFHLLLFDSALSSLPAGTQQWIDQSLLAGGINVIATHVPVNIPLIRDWIRTVAPGRDLRKYVQSGEPHLYDQVLRGRVHEVFTGHLHLPGRLHHEATNFHLLNMSISTHDTGRDISYIAEATVVQTRGASVETRTIRLD